MPAERGVGVEVVEVDPFDDDLLGRWWAVHAASQRHGREDTAAVWTLPEDRKSVV